MNLRNIMGVMVVAVSLAVVAGCGDRQLPTPPAPTGSIADQITATQNNPNLSPQAKATTIARLQAQQHAPGAGQ